MPVSFFLRGTIAAMNHGTTLQRAAALMRSGRLAEGDALCRDVLRVAPNHPGALHLLALAARDAGQPDEAEAFFRESLGRSPKQPGLLVDFGNFLRTRGRLPEAESHLRRAIEVAPDFVPALYALAMLLRSVGRLDEATTYAREVVRRSPRDAAGWELLAALEQQQGRFAEAIATCRQGLVDNPSAARLHYSLGQLLRQDCSFADAVDAYEAARRCGFEAPDLFRNLGEAALEAGDVGRALATFADGVERHPDDASLQRLHARFRWESGAPGDALAPLWQTARERPRNAALWQTLIDLLNRLERHDESAVALAEAFASGCERTPELMQLDAMAAARIDRDEATRRFEAVVRTHPGHMGLKLAFAEHLLVAGDPARAEALCADALTADRHGQLAWALRGTAWRLLGDARASWLLDYESMVMPIRVRAPEGYARGDDFFRDVQTALEALHRTQSHPIEQTVRGGTQTNGYLFRLKHPLLRVLERQLREAVREAIVTMPRDAQHPFWGRRVYSPKGDGIRFAGAWSVRLRSQGYHTNHIHSQGWISSALYVALPREVREGDDDAGCIQFGVPPFPTSVPLAPRRVVRPAVGELVLFPSYMWHGTVPFSSDEPRITVAFDVVPEP